MKKTPPVLSRDGYMPIRSYACSDPIISNSFLKSIHGFLLRTLPVQDVISFFTSTGYRLDGKLFAGHALLRHIRNDRRWTPADFAFRWSSVPSLT